jgi:hypothetical protein
MMPLATKAAQGKKSVRLWLRFLYSVRFNIGPSRDQMGGIAKGPAHDIDESGVMFGCPHRQEMADQPEASTNQPKPKAKADGGRERAIDDGDGSRRTAEEDWFA